MSCLVAAQTKSAVRWLVVLGAALMLLTLGGLVAHEMGTLDPAAELRKAIFVGLGVLAALTYFGAVILTLRYPLPRRAVWIVLAVAASMRLVALVGPPFLSTDLYRYVWDGRVQANGINPYRYIPTDAALVPLRDADVYPRITRANYAHTIYPPAAQALFLAVAEISQTPLAMRIVMVAFEVMAVLAMLRLLDLAGLNGTRVAIYAWNPVTVWEFAGNGHIDAAYIGLLALTMLACARHRHGLAGVALGLAILMKFLPLAVFPALWRPPGRHMIVAVGAVVVALYACYSSAGWAVLGFLPGYAAEEQLSGGNGIYWLEAIQHVVALPAWAGQAWMFAAAVSLILLSVWMVSLRPRPDAERARVVWAASGVAIMATGVTLAITPHYTWYFAWLALPSCIAPFASVIWLSAAAIVMYHDPFDDRALQFSLIYVPFLLLAIRDIRRRIRLQPSTISPFLARKF